jgi:phage major head subunit gpT-like protein
MAGVLATGNFAELLWPGIIALWGTKYKQWDTKYAKFFTIQTSDKAFEKVQQITGFPKAAIKEEGNEAYFAQMYQGYQKEYRPLTYSIGAVVTREMVEDDQYNVIRQIPTLLAKSMRETEEVVAHNVLNNAFDATVLGPDGSTLCATNHTLVNGTTLSNRPATDADLSLTSLENAITSIMRFTDDQGLQINVKPTKLVVPSDLYFTANKILESQYVTGSADNDVNIVTNMGLEPIDTPYLTDTDAWFLVTDVDNGLNFFRRRAAELDQDNDFETDNLKMKTTTRFAVGFDDFRKVYGTTGA